MAAHYHQDIVSIDLDCGNIHRSFLHRSIGTGDSNANRFGVRVFRGKDAVDLSGVSCQGYFRNSNGENIALTSYGTVEGNKAFVTLPQACYNYEGQFTLAIKLVGGGITGTMRIIDGMVDNTHTGGAVAPTGSVPTYQEVLSAYDDAIAAVEDVNELKGSLSVLPDTYDNMISPANSVLSGLKWNNGVLENILTDSKDYFRLIVEKINASDQATQIGSTTDFTEPGSWNVIGYCDSTTKYIKIRHNGTTRDLYVKFPISLDHGAQVIISGDVLAASPDSEAGLKIGNIKAVMYAANKYAASVAEGHHLTIPGDKLPAFTLVTGGALNITIEVANDAVFTNLPDVEKTKTAAQIVTDLPDNAAYADGFLTISMDASRALIYNYEYNRFEITAHSSSGFPEKNCLVLVDNYYGNIFGDWVYHAAYRNEFLKPSVYLGNGTGFSYTNRMNGSVDIYISTSIALVLAGGTTVTISKSDIVTQLGAAAVIEGDNVKITLASYRGLFYNVVLSKLMIDVSGASGNGKIPILFNGWGNIYGPFMDFYFRNKIADFDTRIQPLEANMKLPDYYVAEVNDTANKLSKLPTTNFNYLVFTDIHYSYPTEFTEAKLKNLMDAIGLLGNGANIDAVLFLGDIIEGGATADRSKSDNQINAVFEGMGGIRKPVLCAFGNHDNNMYDFASSASEQYRNTDHYITMEEWKNKAVLPFGITSDYYCKDFPNKGMRVIVTNTCDYRESVDSSGNVTITDGAELIIRRDQVDAIADMMNESTYDMVVFTHGILSGLLSLISKYNSRETYTKENGTVLDFSGKTKKVLLYHTGHYHNNAIEYNSGYNVNIISTSCASMSRAQQTLYSASPTDIVTSWEDTGPVAWNEREIPRTKDTVNETCFDVVSIGAGKINKIGFGASADGTLSLS